MALVTEHAFTIGEVTARDISVLFGDDIEVIKLPEDTRWEDIAVRVGTFKSLSQARKNGFGGDISLGWHSRKIGKKNRVWVLKND